MKKVSAFTIVEIGIAMLLSAVLIVMCYKAYDIINKEIFAVTSKANNNLDELTLRKLIAKDVLEANRVVVTPTGFVCIDTSFVSEYLMEDSMLIRTNVHSDTFRFAILKSAYWNDTNLVLLPGTIINKLVLDLEKNGKQLKIVQEKNTASEVYLNNPE